MLLLNFAHPLKPEHLAQVEGLLCRTAGISEGVSLTVRHLPVQFDLLKPFEAQVSSVLNDALTPIEWETESILVNLPSLNFIAAVMLAMMHGRIGHFPAVLRLRPIAGGITQEYEAAEILNLQTIRDQARMMRNQR